MSKKENNKEIGNLGESIAANFLEQKGYQVIERNYKRSFGEIDIVAKKGDAVHFVEVKTFSRENSLVSEEKHDYRPEELVTAEKARKLRRIAEYFLVSREIIGPAQIDVVAVNLFTKEKKATCSLIEHGEAW